MKRGAIVVLSLAIGACKPAPPEVVCGREYCLSMGRAQTLLGIGAGQGLEVRDGLVWAYGDSATGVIRPFTLDSAGNLEPAGPALALTVGGADEVSHPTGLTWKEPFGTFLGETASRKGTIFRIDWERLEASGNLDGAILRRVRDDAARNGSRPEFVRSGDRWLLASADYGDEDPELRLYDPLVLGSAGGTTSASAVVARLPATGFVQTLHYDASRDLLVLVQNERAGRGWRLTLVALGASLEAGTLQVLDVLEPDLPGELEGFHFVDGTRAVMLTSDRVRNAYVGTLTAKTVH